MPATGSFTCKVTLKNLGHAKAAGVQVSVRPFRGTRTGDEDVGQSPYHTRSDNSALAQFGQWLNLPDLGPGESSTQSVIFLSRPGVEPGSNPSPEITFTSEKGSVFESTTSSPRPPRRRACIPTRRMGRNNFPAPR